MDLSASHNIKQIVEIVSENEKYGKVIRILDRAFDEDRKCKVIIFTATKRNCDEIARKLYEDRYDARALHGDKKQADRDYIMKEFKSGRTSVLIATDVAARGLGKSLIF